MKILIMLIIFISLINSGCVSIQSVSLTNFSTEATRPITDSASDFGFLHLTKPAIDDFVGSLSTRLSKTCADGKLANIRTILSTREFILFQSYEVQMTANCLAK